MLVYLQWGSTPHALTQVAIQTGLWVEGGYAPSSPRATPLFKVQETGLWLFHQPQRGFKGLQDRLPWTGALRGKRNDVTS